LLGKFKTRHVTTKGSDPYSGDVWEGGRRFLRFYLSNVISAEVKILIGGKFLIFGHCFTFEKEYRWCEYETKKLPKLFRILWDALELRRDYYEETTPEDPMGSIYDYI